LNIRGQTIGGRQRLEAV